MRAELAPYALDPFGPSANPSAYVACEASERARAILERSLDEGRVAALMGPPGHGKTLLLRLLGGREEERARVAYVPFCTLEFDELCAVVLNAIGVSRREPPRDALVAATRELATRGGVVILVDDAHAMSDACATALAALYEELGGALRIALAAVQGPAAQRVFRAFGPAIDAVLLAGGLSGRESRRYVEMRLAYGGARPDIVEAFDEATIDALHRASQGVPRRLNQAAEDVVRRATRSDMPRLHQLTARAKTEPDAASAEPAPPTASAAPEAAIPPALETGRIAPARPPAPHVRIAIAPAPSADDGRGILLPEIFDRAPGAPAGEYRIVRGTTLASRGGVAPATPRRPFAEPGRALIAPVFEPPARRREIPMPSASADRMPRPSSSRLPIRAIGIAGFVLGVAVALLMTRILGREPEEPRVLPMVPERPAPTATNPPAPSAVNPPTARAGEPETAEPAPAIHPAPEPPAPAPAAHERIPAPEPAPVAGTRVLVSINAMPWAIVRIDGREIGETPIAGIPLDAGRHVFEARMSDGTTREQTVDVSAQRSTVVFR